MRRLAGVLVVLVLPLSGCALFSKSAPVDLRYFSPESADPRPSARPAGPTYARLRLGRLTSSANLRSPIVRRQSPVEVTTYETLRWTENPESYVRRSLERALFEDGPFEQVVGGAAMTLDVELITFEEARRERVPIGRVQLGYQLQDERTVLASGVVTVDRDAAGDDIAPVVSAIGAAMDAACAELARDLLAHAPAR